VVALSDDGPYSLCGESFAEAPRAATSGHPEDISALTATVESLLHRKVTAVTWIDFAPAYPNIPSDSSLPRAWGLMDADGVKPIP
jgi:hypothetical protein